MGLFICTVESRGLFLVHDRTVYTSCSSQHSVTRGTVGSIPSPVKLAPRSDTCTTDLAHDIPFYS